MHGNVEKINQCLDKAIWELVNEKKLKIGFVKLKK